MHENLERSAKEAPSFLRQGDISVVLPAENVPIRSVYVENGYCNILTEHSFTTIIPEPDL